MAFMGFVAIFCATLVCLSTSASITSRPALDPCLKDNHQKLDQPDRSTAVKLQRGDPRRSDEFLAKAWYVFSSGAGGEIPITPPRPGQCSTTKPIWINGTQPPMDGNIHTLDMCYSLNEFDTCGIQIQIRAKRCLKNIVYELVPTSAANTTTRITDAAYCAGTELGCPPGQSSPTGFTPGCYVAPTVSDKPVIDVVEKPDTFEFHCILTNLRPNAFYKLIWKVDDDSIKEDELQIGQTSGILTEEQLRLAKPDALGKNLTCSVSGRYQNEPPANWGFPKPSEAYFLGIEVSDAAGVPLHLTSWTLALAESDEQQVLSIRSTIPIRCDPNVLRLSGGECKIDIAIRNDNSMENKPLRCRNGVVEQLKLATCSVTITADNWSANQPVAIKATKDFKYDGQRSRVVEFEMTDGPGRSLWDGYVPHALQVVTEDFIDSKAQCSSLNDPHMTTFDGHKWHNYYEGEFVLARHTELPFEVRAFYKRCSARSSVSCNCAVAAKAGDDVIIIDRCNSMGDIKIWGSDKKVEYNLLRTRTLSADDIISPNFKIFAQNGGREYTIYFPHGAMLRVQLTGGGYAQFINLWLNPSPADFNKTEGMCGNFNGDKTDDLRWRNGTLFTGAGSAYNQQPKEFSKHWRVMEGESIYNGQVSATEKTYQKQFCSCIKSTTPGYFSEFLDCQLNSDAQRCDQRGEDITNTNFEYSAPAGSKAPEPFDFDPDWEPPMPSWPTPSGWTKANATKFCEDFLLQSNAFRSCNISMSDDLDMCVEDIKLSDGIEFAMTALESFKDKCLTEMLKDPDAVVPDDAFCLNDCNFHGTCSKGVCYCDSGYAGEDCSLLESSIPNVYFTPFCDVSQEECETANVYGDGFVNSQDLTCSYQPAEIVEGELKYIGDKEQSKASYANFAEVKCPVAPKSRAKRSAGAGGAVQPAAQLAVAVANNPGSQASNIVIYTMYNSQCQTCNFKTGECNIKSDMCLIDGFCYQSGDNSPLTTAKTCRPSHSQTTWHGEDSVLPTWAVAVIAASATLMVITFGIVVYMKLIRKRTKVADNQ